MKLLYTTDLHFNKEWFKWVEKQQNSYDVFCIAGDFLDSSKDATLSQQIEWVTNWIKNFEKPLFVCSGNHDIDEFEDWLFKIDSDNYYCDSTKGTISSIKIGCCGYLDSNYLDFYDCDLLVTHLPPAKTDTSIHFKTKEDWGDTDLTRVIKNKLISPKIILSGHMHHPLQTTSKILNTTIYNCGADKTKKIPNHHSICL